MSTNLVIIYIISLLLHPLSYKNESYENRKWRIANFELDQSVQVRTRAKNVRARTSLFTAFWRKKCRKCLKWRENWSEFVMNFWIPPPRDQYYWLLTYDANEMPNFVTPANVWSCTSQGRVSCLGGNKITRRGLGAMWRVTIFIFTFIISSNHWSALATAPTSASAGAREASNSTKLSCLVCLQP